MLCAVFLVAFSATVSQASVVRLAFDAYFLWDSVSLGEAEPHWNGPQLYQDLSSGDKLGGFFEIDVSQGELQDEIPVNGHAFLFDGITLGFPRAFCGETAKPDSATVRDYLPNRMGRFAIGDFLQCFDETLYIDYMGQKGTLFFRGYPDSEYATDGTYEASFELRNIRENGVRIHPVPVPAGLILSLSAMIGLGLVGFRHRSR